MTAQSPLFPDIVPELDESKWDVFNKHMVWVDSVTGKHAALELAQTLADTSNESYWIAPERVMTCVRAFGLPW